MPVGAHPPPGTQVEARSEARLAILTDLRNTVFQAKNKKKQPKNIEGDGHYSVSKGEHMQTENTHSAKTYIEKHTLIEHIRKADLGGGEGGTKEKINSKIKK